MNGTLNRIVIVGGGTAGWLAACRIAAALDRDRGPASEVTLIESPDVATIGVGEGTWPTMRHTLERIGIGEAEFLAACDGAFKQGSRFDGWATGAAGDHYHHPFTPPASTDAAALVAAWSQGPARPFADAVTPQTRACALGLAPRQRAMPDYVGALNYAYHLDAAKLAALLARHGVERLAVRHLRDHVIGVERAADGDIAAVRTRDNGAVAGDLFIDCTGHAALLIGTELGVPFEPCDEVLFNDSALAVQVPVAADSAIAAQTIATAHAAGWLWDIGLPTRRGIGCVYSSRHMSGDAAEATLAGYCRTAFPDLGAMPSFRQLRFRSGHRARFWERNCLAIGLAAGFLEPLEASAIVLIELSLDALVDSFPAGRAAMDVHATRFNTLFRYRWERIVEFLKLHYLLSRRDEPYWRDHRDSETVPPRLRDLLRLWRDQPPSATDLPMSDEIFPAASYQYVLYGMGFPPPTAGAMRIDVAPAARQVAAVAERARVLASSLPDHRAYLDALRATAAPMVAAR